MWPPSTSDPIYLLAQIENLSMTPSFFGILFALLSATSWGAGDFSGGLAARKHHPYQVLFWSAISSLVVMFGLALIWQEGLPTAFNLVLAVLAGLMGAAGLTLLYEGLAIGPAALVSSVAGVIGALIPMLLGMLIQGLPGLPQLLGILFALVGIWIVTRFSDTGQIKSNRSLQLAVLAGLGFGGFLALMAQIRGDQVFMPLVAAKLTSLLFGLLILLRKKLPIPGASTAGVALISGVLDAGGNIFYLFATQFARLDIAAVLSSLYPAFTVLLSSIVLREKVSSAQWLGVGFCLLAIILITF